MLRSNSVSANQCQAARVGGLPLKLAFAMLLSLGHSVVCFADGSDVGSGLNFTEKDRTTIEVPRQQPTIQAAITAARGGTDIVVTAAQDPGFLIGPMTGDVRISGNTTVTGTATVQGSFVQLNGLALQGGVRVEGNGSVSVDNCRISGGLFVNTVGTFYLNGSTFLPDQTGLVVRGGTVKASGCTFDRVSGTAVLCRDGGVVLRQCRFQSIGGRGVEFQSAKRECGVYNCTFQGVQGVAIVSDDSPGEIKNNTINQVNPSVIFGPGRGMEFRNSTAARFVDENTITGAPDTGIAIFSAGADMRQNRITGSLVGVLLLSGSGGAMSENEIRQTAFGILAADTDRNLLIGAVPRLGPPPPRGNILEDCRLWAIALLRCGEVDLNANRIGWTQGGGGGAGGIFIDACNKQFAARPGVLMFNNTVTGAGTAPGLLIVNGSSITIASTLGGIDTGMSSVRDTVSNGQGPGIVIDNSRLMFGRIAAINNAGNGMELFGATGQIGFSSLDGNGGEGVLLSGGADLTIDNSSVTRNRGNGIRLEGQSKSSFRWSALADNGAAALLATGASKATFEAARISAQQLAGNENSQVEGIVAEGAGSEITFPPGNIAVQDGTNVRAAAGGLVKIEVGRDFGVEKGRIGLYAQSGGTILLRGDSSSIRGNRTALRVDAGGTLRVAGRRKDFERYLPGKYEDLVVGPVEFQD